MIRPSGQKFPIDPGLKNPKNILYIDVRRSLKDICLRSKNALGDHGRFAMQLLYKRTNMFSYESNSKIWFI
jgi:hypothetical protein